MGKTFVYHGPPGSGQHAKLANQILIAANMIGICEGLLYAYKAGLDLDKLLQSTSSGRPAVGLWQPAPRVIANNFAPGFFVEHFIKDMGIILDECSAHGTLPARPGIGPPATFRLKPTATAATAPRRYICPGGNVQHRLGASPIAPLRRAIP